jgi:hypothetical protein
VRRLGTVSESQVIRNKGGHRVVLRFSAGAYRLLHTYPPSVQSCFAPSLTRSRLVVVHGWAMKVDSGIRLLARINDEMRRHCTLRVADMFCNITPKKGWVCSESRRDVNCRTYTNGTVCLAENCSNVFPKGDGMEKGRQRLR